MSEDTNPNEQQLFALETGSDVYSEIASGGVVVGGVSSNLKRSIVVATGGVELSGSAVVSINYISQGGVKVSGTAKQNFVDFVAGTGGVKVGATARVSSKKFFSHVSSGGLQVSGDSSCGITSRTITTAGGVVVSGESLINLTIYRNLTFLWNLNSKIFFDTSFLWNTGKLINYWYRIIARNNCTNDPCCQKYIVNVHARSLSELCEKFSQRKYNFTIESVHQFTRPAINSEITYENDDCNWTPVDLCVIPKCAEYCVDHDVQINFSFDIDNVQVDAFFVYEAGSDPVYLTGSSESYYEEDIPSFDYDASGFVEVSGIAKCVSSAYSYSSSGDVTLSGSSPLSCSNWNFVGGVWPSTTKPKYSLDTLSVLKESGDQIWSLTERIQKSDGLFASTDISYLRKSQILIARGFDFNIPEDSEILNIKVTVNRKANHTGVKDISAYIVKGEDAISKNMAKTSDWPYMIASSTIYNFTDEFSVSDLNSSDIGFAIRINCIYAGTVVAYVDYVTVEVEYEDAFNQKIRVSGNSRFKSTSFSWQSSGGPVINGSSGLMCGKKYISNGQSAIVSGNYGLGLSYDSIGEVYVSGSSICKPSYQHIYASGGICVGGVADVKPYIEVGIGGSRMSGTAEVLCIHKVISSGGVKIGGAADAPAETYSYTPSGGPILGGTSPRYSSSWTYRSDGNAIFMFGEADCLSSDLGDYYQESQFEMFISDILVDFNALDDKHDAKNLTNIMARCGCGIIPLTINFEHRIARDNNFVKFLNRNKLTISNRLTMQHNATNDSWQTNLHYKGLSPDANTIETWDILFDVQCTQSLGSIFIGRQVWKLSMEVVRKNLSTGLSFDTRLIVGILPDEICAANELNFKIEIDTQTQNSVVTPNASVYQCLLYDNVGLFKNRSWIAEPNLILTVSQVGLDKIQNRYDFTGVATL